MLATIRQGNVTRTAAFEAGETLNAVLTRAGFDGFPGCAGRGNCGLCQRCRIRVSGKVTGPDAGLDEVRTLLHRTADEDLEIVLPTPGVPVRPTAPAVAWRRAGCSVPALREGERAGFAVDVGTTTVVAAAVSLDDGRVLCEECILNPQLAYGSDVITRLDAALHGETVPLRDAISACIGDLEKRTLPVPATRKVITGNTLMLHLYAGLDPAGLATAPFAPASLFGDRYPMPDTYLTPAISAYVGGDTTAAMLSCGFAGDAERAFLLDLGTNGEMALQFDGDLTVCSTAAGPAFEGVGLSCGSPALPGAICCVRSDRGVIIFDTVGGAPAKTLCGSGLIDLLAVLLDEGTLSPDGTLAHGSFTVPGTSVTLTQADVRTLQPAIAAVRAGIETLCADPVRLWNVRRVFLAGHFGTALDPDACVRIGLLPEAFRGKTVAVGNAALNGAKMILTDPAMRADAEVLASRAKVLELATSPVFEKEFIKRMVFPK